MADETAPPTTTAKPPLSDADKQKRREFWNNTIQKGAYGLRRSGGGLGGKAAMMGVPMYTNRNGASGPGQYVNYGAEYDKAKMLQEYQAKQQAKYFPATGGPGPAVDPAVQPAAQAAAPMLAEPQATAAGTSLADVVTQPRTASSGGGRKRKSSVRQFF